MEKGITLRTLLTSSEITMPTVRKNNWNMAMPESNKSRGSISHGLPLLNTAMPARVLAQTTTLVMARPVSAASNLLVRILLRPTGLASRKSAVRSLSSTESIENP